MTDALERPLPGSHDRSRPTGELETSAATLFEAMLAARDAEERGDDSGRALREFYRVLAQATLLLPVPPDHGEEAKRALAEAVNDDAEVEINVMLARDADGGAVSVVFGSIAALSAWAPSGSGSLPLPARIVLANLAAAGHDAVMDPAGPLPYRFELDELEALAAGRVPGTDEPVSPPTRRRSIRVRLPGRDTAALEASLRDALGGTAVDEAYLVETDGDGGTRLMLGLVGGEGASATVDVPAGTDVVWLEEPMLAQVRAVADAFHRRAAR